MAWKRSAIFTHKRSQEGEKRGFICAWAEYYLQPYIHHTQLDDIAHEQTIICLQLFAGHVVGSRLMKRKKNLDRMIITFESSTIRSGTSYSGR